MNTISDNENLDILLVLASTFENTIAGTTHKNLLQLTEISFSALPQEKLSTLKKRAELIDNLPLQNREIWREVCLEKLLKRHKSTRLDKNINPVQIAIALSRESVSIQRHILKNLPPNLSQRIAQYLGIKFEADAVNNELINSQIDELIRQEFLANFVSIEDIYEPNDLDKIPIVEINKFILHLGLREVAVACRGINSKETLAAFLNSFNPDNTREIVQYLTELEKVKPFWVARADEMVRDNWDPKGNPERVLEKIGFKLLAISYFKRDSIAKKYTFQKFSTKDAQNLKRNLLQVEKEYNSENSVKVQYDNRCKIVEKSAARFMQFGRL